MDPAPDVADFFVSYAAADEVHATWIAETLEAAGHSVRIQVWDVRPGENFLLAMHRFATSCARTVLVLSHHVVAGRPFVDLEWSAALVEDPDGSGRKLVPVRVDDCRPVGLLAAIAHIDLSGLDRDTARDRLLGGLGPVERRATDAPFPGAHPAV